MAQYFIWNIFLCLFVFVCCYLELHVMWMVFISIMFLTSLILFISMLVDVNPKVSKKDIITISNIPSKNWDYIFTVVIVGIVMYYGFTVWAIIYWVSRTFAVEYIRMRCNNAKDGK